MASKPTVTLTLAGDESKLTEAFDKVGKSSKEMADKVDDSSKGMRDAGNRFDDLTESADGAEGKFMGFHDVLDGVKGGIETLADPSATLTDKLIGLGQAGADIAGGLASFLIPALSSLWTTLTTTVIPAIWSFTSALLANPITWIVIGIIALIAIIVLMITHWDQVKQVVGAVVDWIVDRWNALMSWFAGIPAWFGRIFGGIGDAIGGAFKSAINFVIGLVNWVLDRINWLLDRINDVSGIVGIPAIPHIPHIPRMHTGTARVPGPPGSEAMAVLQAGETVTSAASSSGGGPVALYVAPGGDQEVGSLIDRLVQTGVITAVAVS